MSNEVGSRLMAREISFSFNISQILSFINSNILFHGEGIKQKFLRGD